MRDKSAARRKRKPKNESTRKGEPSAASNVERESDSEQLKRREQDISISLAPEIPPASNGRSVAVGVLFAATVLAGAVLLFLLEPFVGKSLLPLVGGTPAVWNTCVFFFQFVLLAGYVYVYLIDRYLSVPWQLALQALLIVGALALLPIRFSESVGLHASDRPILSLIAALVATAGLPFFVVSTTAPLAQTWFARARPGASPYWLYIASNGGSLTALAAYPTLVEAWFPLTQQSTWWTYSFVAFAVLSLGCGVFAARSQRDQSPAAPDAEARVTGVTSRVRGAWLLLAFCPSSLMLGVTTHLSSEIAPIPVLWVIPLAIYLLSLMIAFADPPAWLVRACDVGFILCA